jgi:hypothetical protein
MSWTWDATKVNFANLNWTFDGWYGILVFRGTIVVGKGGN